MTISISYLKNLLRIEKSKSKEEQKLVKLLEQEIQFLKKHAHMNIGLYIKKYNEILCSEIGINTAFDKLNDEEKLNIQKFMETKFELTQKDFWLFCTLVYVRDHHLRLWFEISKKK
jgi:hypothetical protein